jgi:hypothetical protein
MADEDKGQKPADQEPGQPQGGGEQQKPQATAEPDTFSREYVEELRRENAKYRTERNDLKTKLEADATAKLEEQGKYKELAEKREAEVEDMRLKWRTDTIRAAVKLEALTMGFNDPADAYVQADLSGVQVGDTGDVTGVKDAVAALIAAKPYLLSTAKTRAPGLDAGAGGQDKPGKTVTLTDEQRRLAQYAGMTEEDYIKYLTMKPVAEVPDAGITQT